MEKHYIENIGEITYVYGENLEEHKKVIEKQHQRIAELEQELAELKQNAIVLPKGFELGQIVYMIPNFNNGLKEIKTYRILGFGFSDIGCRADLSLCVKEKGVEPYYSAGFERFNHSIFRTYEEAQEILKYMEAFDMVEKVEVLKPQK